jgi:hypothetical protein
MTISQIRNPLLRRLTVAFTVAALVIVTGWLFVVQGVRENFGEDIGAAWRGES